MWIDRGSDSCGFHFGVLPSHCAPSRLGFPSSHCEADPKLIRISSSSALIRSGHTVLCGNNVFRDQRTHCSHLSHEQCSVPGEFSSARTGDGYKCAEFTRHCCVTPRGKGTDPRG